MSHVTRKVKLLVTLHHIPLEISLSLDVNLLPSAHENSWLNNVGLLLAVLIGKDGEEIIQVSMVTQVVSRSSHPARVPFFCLFPSSPS